MKEQLERRRKAAASRWNLKNEIVVIGAGTYIPLPGRGDQTYSFRSHSEYFYLTDRERPDGVLAYDPKEGWSDFVARVTPDEAAWVGEVPEEGIPLGEFKAWLRQRKGRKIACLGG